MTGDWSIRNGNPASGTSPLRPPIPAAKTEGAAAPGAVSRSGAIAPTEARFSAASRTGTLNLPSLEAATKAVDKALAPKETDLLKRRLEFLVSPGMPVRVHVGDKAVDLFWPYAPGSRNGGPEQLQSSGVAEDFRGHMAPLAAYFGAGTRGPMMAWLSDQAARGELAPGSPATQGLQAIANTLFWDLPMQQNSDDRLIARGMPVDLSQPEAMVQYLRHQRDAIATLIERQLPEVDGPAYLRAGQELLAMTDAALARAEAFLKGDRRPVTATPLGEFGWYNHASDPAAATRIPADLDPSASPAELRRQAQDLEDAAFS